MTSFISLRAQLLPHSISPFTSARLNFAFNLPSDSEAYRLLFHFAECYAHTELKEFNKSSPEELAIEHPPHVEARISMPAQHWGHYVVYKALNDQARQIENEDVCMPNDHRQILYQLLTQEASKWWNQSYS